MPVPTSIADLSTTAASNSPAGADAIGTSLDDFLRTIQAIIKRENSKGSDITASTTIDIPNDGSYFVVTGNTTIAGISDDWNGRTCVLKFSGTPQLTHSSGFILPGSANITAAAGDCALVVNESTGIWRCVVYQTAISSATQAGVQTQNYIRFTAGGTGDAITGTLSPAIASYTAGLRVTTTPSANTVTGPTLNLNSLGTKTIKKRDAGGAKVALVAGDYNASGPFDFEYDGTDFVLMNPVSTASGVPVGTVIHVAQNTAPTGYLKADGSAISRTTYASLFSAIGTVFGTGDGSTTFNIPDLRGEFVRGWDDSRGVDSGRAFGSAQADEFESHTHYTGTASLVANGSWGVYTAGGGTQSTSGATGGSETRPRNIALLACIKY